jgi:tRNA uridine 5-carboxymethylaminomethyl modification enzyme
MDMVNKKYDIIVIGGGHAGIEASHIASKFGLKVALITIDKNAIGRPSCNPSVGGSAKGHLVKEIDALGGAMGILADRAGIQFKMLNTSKGPAVWSPRAQIDKDLYPIVAYNFLKEKDNLDIIEDNVQEILIKNYKISGIKLSTDEIIQSRAVILTAGTFLNGIMWTGLISTKGGRYGEPANNKISNLLKDYGFEVARLKTGTPPRVYSDTIDYTKLSLHPGDEPPIPFSIFTDKVENKVMCYATATTEEVHDVLRTGFSESPMFTGLIYGVGPRYCPSIEDKVERFSDKKSHKIVLEPEGLNTPSVYVNGFSTSLSKEVQEKGLKLIKGLENVKFMRYGYAIEYDFFNPYQLKLTLETKNIENLYFAGQINGTSGYEEAAAQGLIAGINASLKLMDKEPFLLSRNEAYISVLIDDLVNKEHNEPYRIFTSNAEYRLLLRQDNAYFRLSHYANDMNLIDEKTYGNIQAKQEMLKKAFIESDKYKIKSEIANQYLNSIQENEISESTSIYTLTKRNNIKLKDLLSLTNDNAIFEEIKKDEELIKQLEIEIKYEGYIQRQMKEIEYFIQNENKKIPDNFDYTKLHSISTEAKNKLMKIKPISIGQAARIQGVSATDISILTLFLK